MIMKYLCCLVAFVVVSTGCSVPDAADKPDDKTTTSRVSINGDIVFFEGRLIGDAAKKVKKALNSPEGQLATKLKIRSAGGDGVISREIGEMVFERGLDVEVVDYCVSGCASKIFVAGRKKIIPKDSSVVFHTTPSNMTIALQRSGIENSKSAFAPLVSKDEKFYKKLGLSAELLTTGFWAMEPTCALEKTELGLSDPNRYGVAWTYAGWVPDQQLIEKYGLRNVIGDWPKDQSDIDSLVSPFFAKAFRVNFVTASDIQQSKAVPPQLSAC